jgi:hypothetical protein
MQGIIGRQLVAVLVVAGLTAGAAAPASAHLEKPLAALTTPVAPDVGGNRTDEYTCIIEDGHTGGGPLPILITPVAPNVPFHAGLHSYATDLLLNGTVEDVDSHTFAMTATGECTHADLDGGVDVTGNNTGRYPATLTTVAGDMDDVTCATGIVYDHAPSTTTLVLTGNLEATPINLIWDTNVVNGDGALNIAHADDVDTLVAPKTGLGSGGGQFTETGAYPACVAADVSALGVFTNFTVATE